MIPWQRVIGGLSGGLSVAASAYGAHGLQGKNEKYVKVFETSSRLHMIHSVMLITTPFICGQSKFAANG